MSISLVDEFASFERLPALDTSDVAGELPRDFTAVRFYFNESFPDNEENKLFVTRLLQTLTEAGDVVLLNPDLHIDDHWDPTIRTNPRIHSVDHLMTPRNNLEIQTKVISRARAFVGTYGGLVVSGAVLRCDVAGVLSRIARSSRRSISNSRVACSADSSAARTWCSTPATSTCSAWRLAIVAAGPGGGTHGGRARRLMNPLQRLMRRWLDVDEQRHDVRKTARTLSVMTDELTMLQGLIHHQTDVTLAALRTAGWQSDEEVAQTQAVQRALRIARGTATSSSGPGRAKSASS